MNLLRLEMAEIPLEIVLLAEENAEMRLKINLLREENGVLPLEMTGMALEMAGMRQKNDLPPQENERISRSRAGPFFLQTGPIVPATALIR